MINSKLIQLYSALNKEEKTLLKKWVCSPVHNQHSEVVQLFDFLFSKKKITTRVLAKEKVFKAIYPTKEYDDLRLRHLMSLGVGLLEDFVGFLMQRKNKILQKKHLIDFYEERNLNKLLVRELKKMETLQEKQTLRDQRYYYHHHDLELKKFYFFTRKDRIGAHNIPALLETHSILMVLEVLENACVAANTHHIDRRNNYKVLFLEEVLKVIEEGTYKDIFAVQLYYNAYRCATFTEDNSYFYTLSDLLLKAQGKVQREYILNIYHIAINYCIRKVNTTSDVLFRNKLFALYQLGIQNDWLLEYGVLDRFSYKNIVSLGLLLREIDWVEQFIKEYTYLVEEEHRSNYHRFVQLLLAYEKGENEKALQLLSQTEFDDLFLNIAIKNIQIKIYYEMGLLDILLSFLNTCDAYLQRNAKMIKVYEMYRIFIRLVRRLVVVNPYDKQALKKLKQEIAQNPLSKEWLIEQVNKLMK